MAGCKPNISPGSPQVGCAGQALSLAGPATIPAEFVMAECVIDSTHMVPSKHMKGSLNYGGGGSGSGSGCGKQAPCSEAEEESKSCGGGGGGCGSSKKTECSPCKYKVVFKDINGNAIPVEVDTGKIVTIQEVEKQSAAKAPFTTQRDIDGTEYDLTSENKRFDKWSNDDWTSVSKDVEVSAVYRDTITDRLYYATNTLIKNKISECDADEIQDFSDEYLNYKCGIKITKRSTPPPGGYQPHVKEYGKYNAAIDECIDDVQTITNIINGVFTTLAEHTSDCIDWTTFHDLKKCLLNIQSSFIFQTRMAINLDLQDIHEKLMTYVSDMMEKARNGEEISNDIKEHREELDLDLDFFRMDTKDRYKEFKEAFNSYVDTINKCFVEPYIEKIS